MGKICKNCGKELEDNIKFCPSCGQTVQIPNMQVIQEIYNKEKLSTYIWIAVVIYQALVGFYYPSTWAFAVWNTIAIFTNQDFCKKLLECPVGIIKHYEDALISDIIFLCLNLCLGGIVGAVGAGYDLYVRSYVMAHKEELLTIENAFAEQNG